MTEQNEGTPPPNNQSPETIAAETETVSIGEIVSGVVEGLKGLIPGAAANEQVPPAAEAAPPVATTEAPVVATPPAPAAPVAGESVADTVRRVLAEKDTDSRLAAVEQRTAPAPKPPRSGIGALLFGKDRA